MKLYKYEFNTSFLKSRYSVSTVKLTQKHYSHILWIYKTDTRYKVLFECYNCLWALTNPSSFLPYCFFPTFAVQMSNINSEQNKTCIIRIRKLSGWKRAFIYCRVALCKSTVPNNNKYNGNSEEMQRNKPTVHVKIKFSVFPPHTLITTFY